MSYNYDTENIFAKILRNEIPSSPLYETTYSLAFNDIEPQARHHVLVIPKGAYVNFDDFTRNATSDEIVDFYNTVSYMIKQLRISPKTGASGYRLIANTGEDAGQLVPHFHMHILAGEPLGPLVYKGSG